MRIKHILWNFLGLGIPLIIAVLTVPRLLETIGSERFGLLALSWGLIGYAGVLDLGIGRATTQKISVLQGENNTHQIANVLATALRLTIITGTIGMVLIALASLFGAYTFIKTEIVSTREMQLSMLLLAIALPTQAVSATYRGVNEAYLNFRNINILRIVLGAANFGVPFFVAFYTTQVHWLVFTIVLSRLMALWFYRNLAYRCLTQNGVNSDGTYSTEISKQLFNFGAWFTISNILSPLLVQADRFFIGALISATAITTYVLPYEATTQALIIVGSVTSVIFPAISQLLRSDPKQALILFNYWLMRITIIMGLGMSLVAYALPIAFQLWLGASIESTGITVGRILCLGVFFNAIGSMYFSLLHARGKTKITAIIHIIEIPFFITTLFFCITNFGIIGAAIAWSARMLMDLILLITANQYYLKTKPIH